MNRERQFGKSAAKNRWSIRFQILIKILDFLFMNLTRLLILGTSKLPCFDWLENEICREIYWNISQDVCWKIARINSQTEVDLFLIFSILLKYFMKLFLEKNWVWISILAKLYFCRRAIKKKKLKKGIDLSILFFWGFEPGKFSHSISVPFCQCLLLTLQTTENF